MDKIADYSVEEYKVPLNKIKLNEKQIEMLNLQYNAPDRTVEVFELAKTLGYSNHNPVNGQYGRIGNFIADALNIEVTKQKDGKWHWWRTISDECDSEGGVRWKMKPNVAKALLELGIVNPE